MGDAWKVAGAFRFFSLSEALLMFSLASSDALVLCDRLCLLLCFSQVNLPSVEDCMSRFQNRACFGGGGLMENLYQVGCV